MDGDRDVQPSLPGPAAPARGRARRRAGHGRHGDRPERRAVHLLRQPAGAHRRGRDARQRRSCRASSCERASPIDIPTITWRALSRHARVTRHRRVRAVQRAAGVAGPLARRAAAAAAGRRRLHRRGRRGRVSGDPARDPGRLLNVRPGGGSSSCGALYSRPSDAPICLRPCLPSARAGSLVGWSPPAAGCALVPDVPGRQPVEPTGRRPPGRDELGPADREHRLERPGPPGLRDRLQRRAERDPVRGRLGKHTRRVPVSFQYASESDKRRYPLPRRRADRGRAQRQRRPARDRRRPRLMHGLRALRRLSRRTAASAGTPARARSSTCARTICGPPAGPRPTPPDCRSSLAWRATTRSPPASIDHALRFTAPCTAPRYVYPARHEAATCSGPNLPPMGCASGSRRASTSRGLPYQARVVAEALKRLRNDPRRQRLALVHLGRAEPALEQRRPAPARPADAAATSRSSTRARFRIRGCKGLTSGGAPRVSPPSWQSRRG